MQLAILDFLLRHKTPALCIIAAILALLTLRGCQNNIQLQADLRACQEKGPVMASSAISSTAKVITKIQIVYKDKDNPCPDVAFETETESAVSVSATASTNGRPVGPSRAQNGLYLGATYLSTGSPQATVGLLMGRYQILGGYGLDSSWQAGASYGVLAWQ